MMRRNPIAPSRLSGSRVHFAAWRLRFVPAWTQARSCPPSVKKCAAPIRTCRSPKSAHGRGGGRSAHALALAVGGMYGVLSYSVSQRAREFGVRLALGARERDVVAMVTGQAIRLALAGVVAGLALSVLLGRLVASLLYGVTPRDPATLAGAALLAAAIGLAGAYVPARRAARVDPAVSLRCE